MRLELTRRNRHYPLKVACLPIPPPARLEVPRTGLEPACLSTHAPETCASTNSATSAFRAEDGTRTRDPNLGKVMLYQLSYFRVDGCKDRYFFLPTKRFWLFFIHYFSDCSFTELCDSSSVLPFIEGISTQKERDRKMNYDPFLLSN